MTYLGTSGDTSAVKESEMNKGGQYPELEPGWYQSALVSDKVQKKNWGVGLQLQFQIDEGEHEGGKFSDYLCIDHEKSKVQHIARIRLRELATAAGHPSPDSVEDTDNLMGVPIMVRIYRQAASDLKYAAADGTEQRVGEYLSVADWKAKQDGAPAATSSSPTNSPGTEPRGEEPPAHSDEDEPSPFD